ncbi:MULTISPECIES: histidinol dehydrogenase [unclassified Microcella]|uniref:histidinol dehydrogenase n=1 Tax=unclassified Microcella TaxID=2630066 RepID=UPI0006FE70C6|nr:MULTISPECIES: histidinol dehydrogenase [unclassified Microcella]KQV25131.1 histidinol dehydrogenase [Yonghaparkia sp. Root332]KRF31413.1 histidinol dehydrogenase [Yonghaparkia sp. Soil809]
MIQTLDLRGRVLSTADLLALVPRSASDIGSAVEAVDALIADVRARGAAALLDQAERFDRVRPPHVRVPLDALREAEAALDPAVREALVEAIDRVRRGTAAQVPPTVTTEIAPGARIVQRWQPVDRVGLYVPGGKAVYPSSVVMNVVAAQVAGVASIALASPAQAAFGGAVHPTILGAAHLLGVDEVYAMGGAGAIGALAYGVPELGLEPVQVITGPGNLFVATAKRAVTGVVGIDSEAGPTEILVIADESASADLVVADLVSQAEHDELAGAVLVTDSPALAAGVEAALPAAVAATRHRERVEIALSGPQSALVLVDDLDAAARFSNAYAPEHLEVQVRDPHALVPRLTSAGAVFVGDHTPVSLGDYIAGSNHVLPTGGQARFAAGLGAYSFLRPQQIVEYDRAALRAVADRVGALSEAEQLPAHGEAVRARFRDADG